MSKGCARRGGPAGAAARWLALALALAALTGWPRGPGALAQTGQPSQALLGLQEISANFYKAGAYEEALEFAEKALAETVKEFGAEHERTGIQTYSLGLISEAAGKAELAEKHYTQSVRIREKVYGPESAGVAQALEKLGGVMLRAGRLDDAERIYGRVLKIRRDIVGGEHSFTASAQADLGAVALYRRNFDAALGYYREAVRLVTSQTAAQVLAKSVVEAEVRRHAPAFAGLAHAASEIKSRPGADAPALLAETFAASQQAWSTSAAAALAKMAARIGQSNTDLGRRIRQLQDKSERILALHDEDTKALAAWSEVQRADPRYAGLLEAFREASITQARVNAPAIARQRALVAELTALMARCPPGRKSTGCEASDGERDRITKELGALSGATSKGSAELMALNQRMQAAEQVLPGYQAFTSQRVARLAESQGLERAVTEERAAIVRTFPDYNALTEPKPLAIAEVQALLQPDEALLTILTGPARSFVWAISRERAEWAAIDASADVLAAHVAALRRGLDPFAADQQDAGPGAPGAAVAGGFDVARAHELYRLVLAPVARVILGKQHLIVVPTGPLSSLPFQVLVAEPPRAGAAGAQALATAQWLIRRHALSVLPSVQSLAALRKLARAGAATRPFLGIGDPVLTGPGAAPPGEGQQQRGAAAKSGARPPLRASALYRNGSADVRSIRALTPLPETAAELAAIAKVLGAPREALMLGEAATETRVKAIPLDQFRIVQFATHGLVTGELSGLAEPALVLTPPDAPTAVDDGLLTASEIAALRLDADWVVLSACNTASGNDTGAEALSGLARAFFYAGARTLLVSHWAVQSDAAVELTTGTFAALARTPRLGRAEAFRRTMLAMIEAGQPPGHWAPFVIVGEAGSERASGP